MNSEETAAMPDDKIQVFPSPSLASQKLPAPFKASFN